MAVSMDVESAESLPREPLPRSIGMDFILQEPRNILLLFGWEVGDASSSQIAASFMISILVAIFVVMAYLILARMYCGRRSPAARRAREVAERQSKQAPDAGLPEGDKPLRKGKKGKGLTEASIDRKLLWTVHNKRYDLREFVPRHPGGVDAIMLGQGHDCTELYESYHSLANERKVRAILKSYFVEDALPGSADYGSSFEWRATPFFDTLKARVKEHFKGKTGYFSDHRATLAQWLQLLLFTAASAVALFGFMIGNVFCMFLLPFLYWWGPSPCMHDGAHFALSRKPWVNQLFAHIGGAHMSLFSWYHQHTIGHHVDTNVPGCDPDLYHFAMFADSGMPGFRTSLELRTLPEWVAGRARSRWWREGLFRVPFSTIGPMIPWDMMSLAKPDFAQAFLGVTPYRSHWLENKSLDLHSVGQSVVLWFTVIHPITVSLVIANNWFFGIVAAFFRILIPYAIHGSLFYIFSQVSHVQEECQDIVQEEMSEAERRRFQHSHPCDKNVKSSWFSGFHTSANGSPIGAEDTQDKSAADAEDAEQPACERPPIEWAIHQVEHALDYSVDSAFWLHVSNGLNLQVVHHLFPQVGWGHYLEIEPIVREVCKEFNVTYSTKPNLLAALSSHYDYLKSINDEPNGSLWIRPPAGRAGQPALAVLDQVD